jgi:hypothetical protein
MDAICRERPSLVVKVGASTICTINGPISTQTKTTCSAQSLADNTYTLNCSAAFSCSIRELVARNSTISQFIIINGAFGGATVSQWAAATPINSIQQFQPDLCIINDLGNDIGAGTSAAITRLI